MLTAKQSTVLHATNDFAFRAMLNRTSGGSSETELKELTVAPSRSPSEVRLVMTATPVGKSESTSRNARAGSGADAAPASGDAMTMSCAFERTPSVRQI